MTEKDKYRQDPVTSTEQLLADERIAKYMRKQSLLLKVVKTKLWKVLFGKKLYKQEELMKQQHTLLNNLFGDKLDKIDSRYIDDIFLSVSRRQNKSKKPDDLCIKQFYDSRKKRLQKNNFDLDLMQVDISESSEDSEKVYMALPDYLNLLEHIRKSFKIHNTYYEKKAIDQLPPQEVDEDVFTDYQYNQQKEHIRIEKMNICAKEYMSHIKKEDISPEFSSLCHAFYIAFKGNRDIHPLKKNLEHELDTDLFLDGIFFDTLTNSERSKIAVSIKHIFMVYEKLLKENDHGMHLRNMYDVS